MFDKAGTIAVYNILAAVRFFYPALKMINNAKACRNSTSTSKTSKTVFRTHHDADECDDAIVLL